MSKQFTNGFRFFSVKRSKILEQMRKQWDSWENGDILVELQRQPGERGEGHWMAVPSHIHRF